MTPPSPHPPGRGRHLVDRGRHPEPCRRRRGHGAGSALPVGGRSIVVLRSRREGARRPGEPHRPPRPDRGRRHAPHAPPRAGRVVPVSTYRLQIHAGFGYDDAAARAYPPTSGEPSVSRRSPAGTGSTTATTCWTTRASMRRPVGEAFDRLVAAAREHGLGCDRRRRPQPHDGCRAPPISMRPLVAAARGTRESVCRVVRRRWDVEDDRILMLAPVLGGTIGEAVER